MPVIARDQIPASARLAGRPAPTPYFEDAFLKLQLAFSRNAIVAVDGEPGTGKTTCLVYAAENQDRPAALVTMPHRPSPLDLLRLTYQAVIGQVPNRRASRYDLGNDLLAHLKEWRGVLAVDELQNCFVDALQQLVWLHEGSGACFSLACVGSGVVDATARYPQLRSRMLTTATFQRLTGDVLLETLSHVHPSFADTDPALLHQHDVLFCRGLFRDWAKTATVIDALGLGGPLTEKELSTVRSIVTEG